VKGVITGPHHWRGTVGDTGGGGNKHPPKNEKPIKKTTGDPVGWEKVSQRRGLGEKLYRVKGGRQGNMEHGDWDTEQNKFSENQKNGLKWYREQLIRKRLEGEE